MSSKKFVTMSDVETKTNKKSYFQGPGNVLKDTSHSSDKATGNPEPASGKGKAAEDTSSSAPKRAPLKDVNRPEPKPSTNETTESHTKARGVRITGNVENSLITSSLHNTGGISFGNNSAKKK